MKEETERKLAYFYAGLLITIMCGLLLTILWFNISLARGKKFNTSQHATISKEATKSNH